MGAIGLVSALCPGALCGWRCCGDKGRREDVPVPSLGEAVLKNTVPPYPVTIARDSPGGPWGSG